jgi:hypothetical protein
MAMEVWKWIGTKFKWLFPSLPSFSSDRRFACPSSDQPENAKYNEIDGNDVIQESRDKENQDSRD